MMVASCDGITATDERSVILNALIASGNAAHREVSGE
jgi:hypothetical protein